METNKRIFKIWPVLFALLHSVASAACVVDGNQIVCNDPLISVTPEPRWGVFVLLLVFVFGALILAQKGKARR